MKHTVETSISCPENAREILTALLLDLGFEAFEETDAALKAFIPEAVWSNEKLSEVENLARQFGASDAIEIRTIPERDWNEQWEATIRPVCVGRFCIKPGWEDVPPEARDLIVLEIEPKMSFGTGYHETTRLILRSLPDVLHPGSSVLDAGTGTGVLAIAAAKLGADSVFGFDTDDWAVNNAKENVLRNDVADIVEIRSGDIGIAPPGPFDAILANINLNVLLELLPELKARLSDLGTIVLSGVLRTDLEDLEARAVRLDLKVADRLSEGEWCAIRLNH